MWDHYQVDNDASTFDGNIERLRHLVGLVRSADKVLNIGVGNGALEVMLQEKGCMVFSLDPSDNAILRLRERLGLDESSAKIGYSQSIPFEDGFFDVVVMSEVIEHLNDEVLGQTLFEVMRVLRKTGLYIGSVPADEALKENEVVCPDCGKVFHRWGHVQSFTKSRLSSVLSECFDVIRINRAYFGYSSGLNWKGKLIWFVKKIMRGAGVQGSAENYVFVCKKR